MVNKNSHKLEWSLIYNRLNILIAFYKETILQSSVRTFLIEIAQIQIEKY